MSGEFLDQIIQLEPSEIVVGVTINNIRETWDDASIRSLADSIYSVGLQHPITVMEIEDEAGDVVLELVSGARRLRAIQHILTAIDATWNGGSVPAMQYVGDIDTARFVNAKENIDRENLNDCDIAHWIFDQVEDGVTQSELSRELGRSDQWTSARKTFWVRASDKLKDLVRSGEISFSAAAELARKLEKEDQDKYIKQHKAKYDKTISLQDAETSDDPNRTAKPSKKERTKLMERAMGLADQGSQSAQGAAVALRWVEGLQTYDEVVMLLDEAAVEITNTLTSKATAVALEDKEGGE